MPLINYICSCGEVSKKYFNSAKDVSPTVRCKCSLEAKRSFGATSSSHKITVDNGLMARRIEIDPDIMEINDDRARKDYSEDN